MSSLIHPLIGIMASMTLYVSEVPLDVLDLFEIQCGLQNLSQVVVLGLPASGQQANSQLAIRLDQEIGIARAHIHSHQDGGQLHNVICGAGGLARTQFIVEQYRPPSGSWIAGTCAVSCR